MWTVTVRLIVCCYTVSSLARALGIRTSALHSTVKTNKTISIEKQLLSTTNTHICICNRRVSYLLLEIWSMVFMCIANNLPPCGKMKAFIHSLHGSITCSLSVHITDCGSVTSHLYQCCVCCFFLCFFCNCLLGSIRPPWLLFVEY